MSANPIQDTWDYLLGDTPAIASTPPAFGAGRDWMADSLCAQIDTDLFFPEKGGNVRDAIAICRRCTVAAECLDYALANQERFGIWGGLSEQRRRPLHDLTGPSGPADPALDSRSAS